MEVQRASGSLHVSCLRAAANSGTAFPPFQVLESELQVDDRWQHHLTACCTVVTGHEGSVVLAPLVISGGRAVASCSASQWPGPPGSCREQ
jgi:hypothetical protein